MNLRLFALTLVLPFSSSLDLGSVSCIKESVDTPVFEVFKNYSLPKERGNLSIFIPNKREYIDSIENKLNENDAFKRAFVKNHILITNGPIRDGTYATLRGSSVKISTEGGQAKANGVPFTNCGSLQDLRVYALEGTLLNEKIDQKFRSVLSLPKLNETQFKILELYGSKFYTLWTKAQKLSKDSSSSEADNGSIIIVPNDKAFQNLSDHEFLTIVKSHVIPIGDNSLEDILTSPGQNIKDLNGKNIDLDIETKNNTKIILMNGIEIVYPKKVGNIIFFKSEKSISDSSYSILSDQPAVYPIERLTTAWIPDLNDAIVNALSVLELNHFLRIWKDLKFKSQVEYATAKKDICALPKDRGLCQFNIPMFYYDGTTCKPFVYRGCGGNENRFSKAKDCIRSCIDDPIQRRRLYDELCSLPAIQPLIGSNFTCEKALFQYDTNKRYCVQIPVSQQSSCFKTENAFDKYNDCSEICENKEIETTAKQPRSCRQYNNLSEDCLSKGNANYIKWVFKDGKCTAIYKSCSVDPDSLYDFEKDCLKACSRSSDLILTIFAPKDESIDKFLKHSDMTESIFSEDHVFAKRFLLSHFLLESREIDRASNLTGGNFRVITVNDIAANIPDTLQIGKPHMKSSESQGDITHNQFLPFHGDEKLRDKYLLKNSFVLYNDVYESVYKLLNTLTFSSIHKEITDYEKKNFFAKHNDHNSTARGICSLSLDNGTKWNNEEGVVRFYYDPQIRSCDSFHFSGSGGNSNNFGSYEECSNFCGRFDGLVWSAKILSNQNVNGHVLFAQLSEEKSTLVMEASFLGLDPNASYALKSTSNGISHEFITDGNGAYTVFREMIALSADEIVSNNELILSKILRDETLKKVAHGTIIKDSKVKEAKAFITFETNRNVKGEIDLIQEGPFAPVILKGNISGIPEGIHGFHVHEKGNVSNKCLGSGSHFNPHKYTHGSPKSMIRHVGDLGNVKAFHEIDVKINIIDSVISLYQTTNSIIGRALVIHESSDDLGLGSHPSSLLTGNAGSRIGCGIISSINSEADSDDIVIQKSSKQSLTKNVSKGKIFFVPNEEILQLLFRTLDVSSLKMTNFVREFVFCHYITEAFKPDVDTEIYTTECGGKVEVRKSSSNYIIQGIPAERKIQDGDNTFFVIPFALYFDYDRARKEITEKVFSEMKAHINLPTFNDDSLDDIDLKLTQSTPHSPVIGKKWVKKVVKSGVYEAFSLRIVEGSIKYPNCKDLNLTTFNPSNSILPDGDLGTVNSDRTGDIYITVDTKKITLFGRHSILGKSLVILDPNTQTPILCGSITSGHPVKKPNDFPSRNPVLVLPRQDKELKSKARELNITLFFHAWDRAIENGVVVTDDMEKEITIITMTDKYWFHLIPRSNTPFDSHPALRDVYFQNLILGMMIIPGKFDIENIKKHGFVHPYSLNGRKHSFDTDSESGSLTIRSRQSKNIYKFPLTNVYTMSNSYFQNFDLLGPGDVFDSYDRAVYRVKHPNW